MNKVTNQYFICVYFLIFIHKIKNQELCSFSGIYRVSLSLSIGILCSMLHTVFSVTDLWRIFSLMFISLTHSSSLSLALISSKHWDSVNILTNK